MRLFSKTALPMAIMAFACTPTIASAKDRVFTPSGKWIVDYDKDSCNIFREFAHEEQKLTLVMMRSRPGDAMRIQILGDNGRIVKQNGLMTVEFLPGTFKNETGYYAGKTDEGVETILSSSVVLPSEYTKKNEGDFEKIGTIPRLKPELRAKLDKIVIKVEGQHKIIFQTGSLGPILNAFENCTDNLVTYWGFDLATEQSLISRVKEKGSPQFWITSNDYPTGQLLNKGIGSIEFRLTVEADGKPSQCAIIKAAGDKEFADIACARLLERARFTPAMDKDNKPVRSFYINQVSFRF